MEPGQLERRTADRTARRRRILPAQPGRRRHGQPTRQIHTHQLSRGRWPDHSGRGLGVTDQLDTGNLLLCIARDVSEREDAEQRIQHLAYHDTLTGLPNRTLLTDRVNRALARARRTGQIGALLFIDLDKFKRINDSLGHSGR